MPALAGYLALGQINPVTGAFTEATYGGYARQPASFELDAPQAGGAVGTGGNVLRSSLPMIFPAPPGLDWPPLNGFAFFPAATGGTAQIIWGMGGLASVHQRGAARSFRSGRLVLVERDGRLSSELGTPVTTISATLLVGGVLTFESNPQRLTGSIALLGDSRPDQVSTNGGASEWPATPGRHVLRQHFTAWASALSGGFLSYRYLGGVSGARSDQYLARLPAALASDASIVALFGVVNDVVQSGTTGDTAVTIFRRLKAAALTIIRAGRTPLLMTDPGATGLNPTQVGMLMQINAMLIELAEQIPDALLFDLASVVWDQTASSTTALAFKPGYSADGTHFTDLGSYFIGKALGAFLSLYIPPYPALGGSSAYVDANGGIGKLSNPILLGATGGIAGAGVSGSIPAGFGVMRDGTATVTCSVAPAPDGRGNALTLDITGASAGETVTFYQNAAPIAENDYYDIGSKVRINSGADKLKTVDLIGILSASPDGNPLVVFDTVAGTSGPMSTDVHGKTLTLRSLQFRNSPASSVAWWQRANFVAAGAASVTVWAPSVRRRFAL